MRFVVSAVDIGPLYHMGGNNVIPILDIEVEVEFLQTLIGSYVGRVRK
jgi:hypothetical protein